MQRVVLVKNDDSIRAVAKAIEGLGGVDELVKRYSRIVIKPNLGGGVPGEAGSYTSLTVLGAVLELFSSFGLPIVIGEADGSFNSADRMFTALNIHGLAKGFGARVLNLSTGPAVDLKVPDAFSLQHLRVSSVLEDSLLVSVPVLKTHPWCKVTVTMKNMYGAVYKREKAMLHARLDENIVDINRVIAPHISIVDATVAVVHGGFKEALWVGCPPTRLDLVLAGYNPVAVDAVGARVLKCDPQSVEYIRLASQNGLGPCEADKIEVQTEGFEL